MIPCMICCRAAASAATQRVTGQKTNPVHTTSNHASQGWLSLEGFGAVDAEEAAEAVAWATDWADESGVLGVAGG